MKKIITALLFASILANAKAQRCLDIRIGSMMNQLEPPADAASSFKKCNTNKNEHNQTAIVNYGSDLVDLDTMVARTTRNFNYAYMNAASATNVQKPLQQDIAGIKDLSEQLKSMTPEQQKEWAMQMAQEKQKNPTASSMQDDAATSKLVFQTQDLAVNQMKALNDEFSNKLRAMNDAMSNEIDAVKREDKTKCPQDITGLPNCDCANKIAGRYWQLVISITDRYNQKKTILFHDYTVRIKAMAETVDNNVSKCRNGEVLKSSQLKNMLFSAQSAAFGNAFLVTAGCLEGIRKSGADAFANKLNCDENVYDMSCSRK